MTLSRGDSLSSSDDETMIWDMTCADGDAVKTDTGVSVVVAVFSAVVVAFGVGVALSVVVFAVSVGSNVGVTVETGEGEKDEVALETFVGLDFTEEEEVMVVEFGGEDAGDLVGARHCWGNTWVM